MTLGQKDFKQLSEFIYSELGIKMPPAKRTMLSARLQKRLRALEFNTFGQYCDYLFSKDGQEQEMVHLVNVVTTNKTDFFREPAHYDYLTQVVLPDLIRRHEVGFRRKLRLWSAGCSTGEEPYTLTMVLSEYALSHPPFAAGYSILATDISTRVLQMAKNAVYVSSPKKRGTGIFASRFSPPTFPAGCWKSPSGLSIPRNGSIRFPCRCGASTCFAAKNGKTIWCGFLPRTGGM